MGMSKGGRFTPSSMANRSRRYLSVGVFIAAFALWPSKVQAVASGTEGAAFMDIPVGAGPAALGSAYTALAQDAYAPIYNPAGLGFLVHPEVAAQHLSYLESVHYEFGSFVFPLSAQHSELRSSTSARATSPRPARTTANPLATFPCITPPTRSPTVRN